MSGGEVETRRVCPECGAVCEAEKTCQEHFNQMLYWEAEYPAYGQEVHHLMVLSYYLQHPGLYSPEGLRGARKLLKDFVAGGLSPQEVRRQSRERLKNRDWKIKGVTGAQGAYERPVHWEMTAADVTAGPVEKYCDNVRKWARSIYDSLEALN